MSLYLEEIIPVYSDEYFEELKENHFGELGSKYWREDSLRNRVLSSDNSFSRFLIKIFELGDKDRIRSTKENGYLDFIPSKFHGEDFLLSESSGTTGDPTLFPWSNQARYIHKEYWKENIGERISEDYKENILFGVGQKGLWEEGVRYGALENGLENVLLTPENSQGAKNRFKKTLVPLYGLPGFLWNVKIRGRDVFDYFESKKGRTKNRFSKYFPKLSAMVKELEDLENDSSVYVGFPDIFAIPGFFDESLISQVKLAFFSGGEVNEELLYRVKDLGVKETVPGFGDSMSAITFGENSSEGIKYGFSGNQFHFVIPYSSSLEENSTVELLAGAADPRGPLAVHSTKTEAELIKDGKEWKFLNPQRVK